VNSAVDGVKFIAPLEITTNVDGRAVTISPIVLRELPRFMELAVPIYAGLMGKLEKNFFARAQVGDLTPGEVSALLTSIAVAGDEWIGLVALCSRRSVILGVDGQADQVFEGKLHGEWIGGLLPDRAVALAVNCLQVNADFFRRAMPQLRAMAESLAAEKPDLSTTQMPSSSS
jgi:hypothetical protein